MDGGLWSPDRAFVEQFGSRLQFGQPAIKPKALLDEVEGSFIDPVNHPIRPPPRQGLSNFAAAAERYRRALAAARCGRDTSEGCGAPAPITNHRSKR